MIYVNGAQFNPDSSSGHDMVNALLVDPDLVSASRAFCAIPEKKLSTVSEEPVQAKCVYVFQREYATVNPALVDIVGTDEATTCIGMVIRNSKTGMTCVGHLDSPNVVEVGLFQMMALVSQSDVDNIILDVHLVGAFEDSASNEKGVEGYSFPLCVKIVEKLAESIYKFEIKNFQVLKLNTRQDNKGDAYPIFHGLAVETSSGSVFPASFDASTRCPDDIIRKIRLHASFEDPSRSGRLIDTYETQTDRFVITPFPWSKWPVRNASLMRRRSDLEILFATSTSPLAKGPDYVKDQKRVWEYLIQNPNWKQVFPSKLARVFQRVGNTSWVMISET
ncbi:protein N-terminal asparagine amidohydrolase-like [Bidens hawaiensis]|uniref:protein N-terminal asparagine amidohydrolase-like n=1 Tax=Bidens hawaiensis TaxID=980011 RepID=UPI00404B4B02